MSKHNPMKYPFEFVVIDDDDANNVICKTLIRSVTGNECIHTFNSPKMGIDFIEKLFGNGLTQRPTFVLLDINMPSLSGWDVLSALENLPGKNTDKLSVFLLSNSTHENDKERIDEAPYAKGYIQKPLTSEKIGHVLSYIYSS
jgi:CheY-like chemotaxis protein